MPWLSMKLMRTPEPKSERGHSREGSTVVASSTTGRSSTSSLLSSWLCWFLSYVQAQSIDTGESEQLSLFQAGGILPDFTDKHLLSHRFIIQSCWRGKAPIVFFIPLPSRLWVVGHVRLLVILGWRGRIPLQPFLMYIAPPVFRGTSALYSWGAAMLEAIPIWRTSILYSWWSRIGMLCWGRKHTIIW